MEEVKITKSRFKYSGQYSLSSYYNLLYDVFRSNGYDVEEWRYRHKLNPDGSSNELELFWDCIKKIDEYSHIKIFAKTLIVGMGKQQTQIDGKPVTRDTGVVELEMKVSVVIDRLNKWEIDPLLRNFRSFYDVYFYRPIFNNTKRVSIEEHYKVENEMKAFFNMQTFL
jgi:hypothetical protein